MDGEEVEEWAHFLFSHGTDLEASPSGAAGT